VTVEELAPGLWRWTAPHPDWKEGDDWERDVGCVYHEAAGATVLVDPLVPAEPADRERFLEALDRDVGRRRLPLAILLTCAWHARSADELTERYGAVAGPPPGVEAHELPEVEERVWWLAGHSALVPGDVLLGDGAGGLRVCPDSWLGERSSPASIRAALRPLLDLPVERVLVSHGAPVLADGRAALERALAR
jgi:glyoxylase-like metal-dependent hydrolase (beta-lactamase superfamily II)